MMCLKIILICLVTLLFLAVTHLLPGIVRVIIKLLKLFCVSIIALDNNIRCVTAKLITRVKRIYSRVKEYVRNKNYPSKCKKKLKTIIGLIINYYNKQKINITDRIKEYSEKKINRKLIKLNKKKEEIDRVKLEEPLLFNSKKDFYKYQKDMQIGKYEINDVCQEEPDELDKTVLIDIKAIETLITDSTEHCTIDCKNCPYSKNSHCPNCISCILEREGYCTLSEQCKFIQRKECKNYYSDDCDLRKSLLFPD